MAQQTSALDRILAVLAFDPSPAVAAVVAQARAELAQLRHMAAHVAAELEALEATVG